MLSERKKQILDATVDEYIHSVEPVSSKRLTDVYALPWSSATIRNELKELEQDGYLRHVHTSSGRIPTDKGYRFYVDSLGNKNQLSKDVSEQLSIALPTLGEDVSGALESLTQVVSSVIDYTTIVMAPDMFRDVLKMVHLVLVDLGKVLVVMLNSVGVNREFLIDIQQDVSQEELNRLSKLLSEKLEGQTLDDITSAELQSCIAALPELSVLLQTLVQKIKGYTATLHQQEKLLTKGMSKMFRLPEFQDIEQTRSVIEALEENKVLCRLFKHYISSKKEHVLIGKEHAVKNLEGCSLVMVPLQVKEKSAGLLGILGPTRMNYSRVLPMVKHIKNLIGHIEKEKGQLDVGA